MCADDKTQIGYIDVVIESLRTENDRLQERLIEAERVIDEFADGLNWQSAGTYEGKPSEVLLWSGWMRGKSNGPHLARSYRAKYPKVDKGEE